MNTAMESAHMGNRSIRSSGYRSVAIAAVAIVVGVRLTPAYSQEPRFKGSLITGKAYETPTATDQQVKDDKRVPAAHVKLILVPYEIGGPTPIQKLSFIDSDFSDERGTFVLGAKDPLQVASILHENRNTSNPKDPDLYFPRVVRLTVEGERASWIGDYDLWPTTRDVETPKTAAKLFWDIVHVAAVTAFAVPVVDGIEARRDENDLETVLKNTIAQLELLKRAVRASNECDAAIATVRSLLLENAKDEAVQVLLKRLPPWTEIKPNEELFQIHFRRFQVRLKQLGVPRT